ncbi:hypothetical protein [Micromonospora sp. CPCC 205558]|uniref:hypothetical protein n=1 Tax=Micromonospora sp. CPCC 205558 TaxID=3122403 RepID=UPI002FEF56BB
MTFALVRRWPAGGHAATTPPEQRDDLPVESVGALSEQMVNCRWRESVGQVNVAVRIAQQRGGPRRTSQTAPALVMGAGVSVRSTP